MAEPNPPVEGSSRWEERQAAIRADIQAEIANLASPEEILLAQEQQEKIQELIRRLAAPPTTATAAEADEDEEQEENKSKNNDEGDTCRICRSEGTPEEPLFFPCKCSGSIKYVHQTCLMEWLAHTQKKYCELCKTPFHFTKLYDKHMPQRLPTPIFLRELAFYGFRTLLTWSRALLAAVIWLGWLPWSMRAVWRGLFWMADGRWPSSSGVRNEAVSLNTNRGLDVLLENGTSALSESHAAVPSAVLEAVSQILDQGKTEVGNRTEGTTLLTLLKKTFISVFSDPSGAEGLSMSNSTSNATLPIRRPSLLSDFKFLNNLTSSNTLNNFIVDILEGQLITLLVVVAFILVFLIREWVVQQHPAINLAEAEGRDALPNLADLRALEPGQEHDHEHNEEGEQGEDHLDEGEPMDLDELDGEIIWRPHGVDPNDDEHTDRDSDRSSQSSDQGEDWELPPLDPADIITEVYDDPTPAGRVHMDGTVEPFPESIDEPTDAAAPAPTEITNNADTDIATAQTSDIAPNENQTPPVRPTEDLSFLERIIEWCWGGITIPEAADNAGENDERVVQDVENEAPFVPVGFARRDEGAEPPVNGIWGDGPVADAADLNLDAEAVEDAEDLEGIMELIGMQGPVVGLLQNALFCSLLISLTVAIGIWLPYVWGRVALVLMTNPLTFCVKVPLSMISIFADIMIDTLLACLGVVLLGTGKVLRLVFTFTGRFIPLIDKLGQSKIVNTVSSSMLEGSGLRLKKLGNGLFDFYETDLPVFSMVSHYALNMHKSNISGLFHLGGSVLKTVFWDGPHAIWQGSGDEKALIKFATESFRLSTVAWEYIQSGSVGVFKSLYQGDFLSLKIEKGRQVIPLDHDLAYWDTQDRIIAIVLGYAFVFFLCVLYLRVNNMVTGSTVELREQGIVGEILHQAGGVMKVILIIGIEMIVFPLYCGLLLDVALLPLFEGATISSRLAFAASAPLTSLFVHWFIGTCYMFHFALFVSMCRKIMRKGVLYFIRDPDDPTFHPVRDVLERNIATQLKKIGFSALVYGALVIMCLGGVVWGLYYSFENVLPIHWSSSEPVFEFPVDLLFYNFLMPLAIRYVKPSDGLHKMCNWWFHRCARALRLTHFLFGEERRLDEEGHHVRRAWRDVLAGRQGDTAQPVIGEADRKKAEEKNLDAYFLRDGRFVRAPASDQVRLPRESRVFLEVNEENERQDGVEDRRDGLHGSNNPQFALVYVPPMFRVRIALFIGLIWAFAAATGVGITIIPLLFGRRIASALAPDTLPVNDAFAFSIGIYTTGTLLYGALHAQAAYNIVKRRLGPFLHRPVQAFSEVVSVVLHGLRLAYMVAAFGLVLPFTVVLLAELFFCIPLHTYLGGGDSHVIYLVQDWTLGVLYLRMGQKMLQWHANGRTRPAAAVKAIVKDGWLNPDANLATKAIIVPTLALASLCFLVPTVLALSLNFTYFADQSAEVKANVFRYAFPAVFSVVFVIWLAHLGRRQIESWRSSIRDDVYQIGERLHNLGERKIRGDMASPRRVATS